MRDDRRRRREGPGGQVFDVERAGPSPDPTRNWLTREELESLHEEVCATARTVSHPGRAVRPEGLTHQEAAQRLRCPLGTIGVRLRRARERLRNRLTRRGLAPIAGLLGVLLRGEDAAAAMPTVLIDSTVRAAMGCGSARHGERPRLSFRCGAGGAGAAGDGPEPIETRGRPGPGRRCRRDPLVRGASRVRAGLAGAGEPRSSTEEVRPAVPEPEAPGREPARRGRSAGPIAGRPRVPNPRTVPRSRPADSGGRRLRPARGSQGRSARIRVGTRPRLGRRRPPPEEPARGEALFAKEWLPDDPRGHGGDGLGPVYNDTSCVACHSLGAPAAPGRITRTSSSSRRSQRLRPSSGLDQVLPGLRSSRSAVVHHFSTDPGYTAWRSRLFNPQGMTSQGAANRGGDPVATRIRALREQRRPTAGCAADPPAGAPR